MNTGIDFLFPEFFTLPVEVMRTRSYNLAASSTIKKLRTVNFSFDLIHAHRMDICGFVGASLKEIYNKPLVLTTHGSDTYDLPFRNKQYLNFTKFMIGKADRIITTSKADANNLYSLGASTEKIVTIPNGFNNFIFKPMPLNRARQLLNLPSNEKIIICIATFHEVKGHTYLIDAMNIISRINRNIKLILVGSGPLENYLKDKIKMLKLDNILFAGWKEHSEIPLWINAADILVLPSLNEGLPTVIPEAMACGKPVIATRVGGIPEILSNNDVGIVIVPKDPESLANAIIYAVDKKWDARRIEYFAQAYSLDTVTNQILEVYRSAFDEM